MSKKSIVGCILIFIIILGLLGLLVIYSLGGATDGFPYSESATIAGIRPLTILHIHSTQSSDGICPTLGTLSTATGAQGSIHSALNDIAKSRFGTGAPEVYEMGCVEGANKTWAVWIQLLADTTKAFCIDENSIENPVTNDSTSGIVTTGDEAGEVACPPKIT